MEKPIRKWLHELPEPIRTRALKNMRDIKKDVVLTSISDAIIGAFDWDSTKQGYDYWNDLYNKYKHGS